VKETIKGGKTLYSGINLTIDVKAYFRADKKESFRNPSLSSGKTYSCTAKETCWHVDSSNSFQFDTPHHPKMHRRK